jgi:hypothetical protein
VELSAFLAGSSAVRREQQRIVAFRSAKERASALTGLILGAVFRQWHQGQIDAYARSLPGRRIDRRGAAEQPGALADAAQSEMLTADGSRIEADSPVSHLDADAAFSLGQLDADFLGLTVPAGVRETFLHDAEQRAFQRRGQSIERDARNEVYFDVVGGSNVT